MTRYVAGPAANASRPFSNTTGRYLNKNSNRASNATPAKTRSLDSFDGRPSADLSTVPAFTRLRAASLATLAHVVFPRVLQWIIEARAAGRRGRRVSLQSSDNAHAYARGRTKRAATCRPKMADVTRFETTSSRERDTPPDSRGRFREAGTNGGAMRGP